MISFGPSADDPTTLIPTAFCDRHGCPESAPMIVESEERVVGLSGPHIRMEGRVPADWTAGPESGGDVLLLCPKHRRTTIELNVRTA